LTAPVIGVPHGGAATAPAHGGATIVVPIAATHALQRHELTFVPQSAAPPSSQQQQQHDIPQHVIVQHGGPSDGGGHNLSWHASH
jgi:hypothetical protein